MHIPQVQVTEDSLKLVFASPEVAMHMHRTKKLFSRGLMWLALGLAPGNILAQTTLTGDHVVTGTVKLEDKLTVEDTNTGSSPSSFLFGAYDDPLSPGTLIGGFDMQYDAGGNLDYILRETSSAWTWWISEDDGTGAKETMALDSTGTLTVYGRDGSGNPVESIKLFPAIGSTAGKITVDDATALLSKSGGRVSWGYSSTASGFNSTAWGYDTQALNISDTAWGSYTTASGESSTAWGQETEANGNRSTAWGSHSLASGILSTAWGLSSAATADLSTAWGTGTAAGDFSTAFGAGTIANSIGGLSIGTYNKGLPADFNGWEDFSLIPSSSPMIEVGNGTYDTRSNAMTLFRGGDLHLAGKIQAKAGVRVPQQGDLSMGNFTAGDDPADLDPALGLLYPAP